MDEYRTPIPRLQIEIIVDHVAKNQPVHGLDLIEFIKVTLHFGRVKAANIIKRLRMGNFIRCTDGYYSVNEGSDEEDS